MRVKSNLKALLDSRDLSIRGFAKQANLPTETVRRLYNDDTMQYQRDTIGAICKELNIGISDLLILEDVEKSDE